MGWFCNACCAYHDTSVCPNNVPPLPVDRLEGDPRDWEANRNMREWMRKAVEAKGAKFTGGGFGADMCDLDIELEGFHYNIAIRPRRR